MYFQDESRFGLFTKNGRALTAMGVKPICPFHQVFKPTYLYGSFSPIDGQSFLMEFANCNSENFQIYLDEFAKERPDELKIIILDNAAFHKSKSLMIPKNIAIVFQPPYSPEVNPAERVWEEFKRDFTGRLFTDLKNLREYVYGLSEDLNKKEVMSLCGYDYIFADNFWTNL